MGISKDGLDSHHKFIDKYHLNFLLLSDPESRMIKAYGAYGDKGIFGFGTLRKTFILDKNGKLLKAYEKVKPDGHEREVLEFLKSLR